MENQDFEHITVFLPSGATLRFESVTRFQLRDGRSYTFKYVSASDKKSKSAIFYTDQIVGFGCCLSDVQ